MSRTVEHLNTFLPGLGDVCSDVFLHGDMPVWKNRVRRKGYVDREPLYMFLLMCDVTFRGISQVYLCDHPVTGLLVFAGLCCSEVRLGFFAILGSLTSTVAAVLLTKPTDQEIFSGLCGYDGTLIGCACAVMVTPAHAGGVALVLALVGGMLRTGCRSLLRHLSMPSFTAAFNIVLLLFLSAVNARTTRWQLAEAVPTSGDADHGTVTLQYFMEATVLGVGQFIFAGTVPGSVLVVLGCAVASRKAAFALVLGSLLAWVVALYVLVSSPEQEAVRTGLYGYNAAGACAVVAGEVFYAANSRTLVMGGCAAIWAVFVTVGLRAMFRPYPVLTFPFILSSWLFLISCEGLLEPYKLKPAAAEVCDSNGGIGGAGGSNGAVPGSPSSNASARLLQHSTGAKSSSSYAPVSSHSSHGASLDGEADGAAGVDSNATASNESCGSGSWPDAADVENGRGGRSEAEVAMSRFEIELAPATARTPTPTADVEVGRGRASSRATDKGNNNGNGMGSSMGMGLDIAMSVIAEGLSGNDSSSAVDNGGEGGLSSVRSTHGPIWAETTAVDVAGGRDDRTGVRVSDIAAGESLLIPAQDGNERGNADTGLGMAMTMGVGGSGDSAV